ncbi:hypothetical protein PMKS-002728 [Pichia membranifaciens]|uniref:Uncharacterized protein n=1 Tax=Pichia membranifaciens TaxID=4926 RepID=A0A1Q2YI69_9ASCO|nr:hypothetical protein PMKS-002728 [Pichia membranifaciens]
MEGEIFDFDPVSEQCVDESKEKYGYADRDDQEKTSDSCTDGINGRDTRYSVVNMLENEFADEERQEKGEHDYNALQEGNILDYLNEKDGIATDGTAVGRVGDVEEDEEAYDRYVPTDQGKVEDYLKQMQVEDRERDAVNFKAKHIVRSENDSGKIRFSKSIIGMAPVDLVLDSGGVPDRKQQVQREQRDPVLPDRVEREQGAVCEDQAGVGDGGDQDLDQSREPAGVVALQSGKAPDGLHCGLHTEAAEMVAQHDLRRIPQVCVPEGAAA